MPQRKFKATEGLLSDVMRKQSGVIEKAWLEALMNGVDANASEIHFEIDEKSTHYWDDGDSMTQSEVEQYFEQFGLKDSDIEDKEFGKFRMGRGQIFNFGLNIWRAKENYMVVSLDDKKAEVHLPDCTEKEDESVLAREGDLYRLDTSGLSYAMLGAEHIDEGIDITVKHYNPINDLDDTLSEFRKLAKYVPWVHGVDVFINGDEIESKPDLIEETDSAWFAEGDSNYYDRSHVYNKGAFVDTFDIGPKSLTVISKDDLDVTLDRTDILDTDDYWDEIKDEYEGVVVSYLSGQDDMSTRQRNWLLEKAAESQSVLQSVKDTPLLEDATGDILTIEQAAGERIGFSSTDDAVAQDAMDRGSAVMLNESHEDSFKKLAKSSHTAPSASNIDPYSEIVDKSLAFEMKEVSYSDLSKRRKKNLDIIDAALHDLGFNCEVCAGYSNHKNVWKDDNGTVFVHKDYLNSSKNKLATEVMQNVVIVASHDGETMSSLDENYSLKSSVYKTISGLQFAADTDYPTVQQRILDSQY